MVLVSPGVVYLVDQVLWPSDPQGKRYVRPYFAGAILGAALFGWGVRDLVRSARLLRRWRQEAGD